MNTNCTKIKLPEPEAWLVTTELQNGTYETYPTTGRYKYVKDVCDVGLPTPLYSANQVMEIVPMYCVALEMALASLKINRTNFRKTPSKSICKMLAGGNDEIIDQIEKLLHIQT